MGRKDALPRDEMVDYVMSCWDDEAGMFLSPLSSYIFLSQVLASRLSPPASADSKGHSVHIQDTMVIYSVHSVLSKS